MHYLLFYEFVPDYVARRAPFRSAHLLAAWKAQERGELVLAGAYAALLFRCESKTVPEHFVASDPYVIGGLVTRWHIREWATVVGKDATTPVRAGTR
jgi:uncharacterized protein YciI